MRRLLALMLLGLTAGAARAEPPVWVVSDADSEVVIFGSVHILPPGLAWRPAKLDAALSEADDIWFEIGTDPATRNETAMLAAQRGVLGPGQSLSGLLPAPDKERLDRVARAYGVDPGGLDRLDPWLAEVALISAVALKAGASPEHGVEAVVDAAAPAGTPRRALETPAEQIAFFDEAALAEQVASLRDTLEELESDPRGFEDLVGAWLAGDVQGLEREALDPVRKVTPGIYRRIVVDRNIRWVEALRRRLDGAGRTVVVVGVGHLIGQDGVPERLRALGYSVSGP